MAGTGEPIEELEKEKEDLVRQLSLSHHISQRIHHLTQKIKDVKVFIDSSQDYSLERIQEKKKQFDEVQEKIQNHRKSQEIFEIEQRIHALGFSSVKDMDDVIFRKREQFEKEWKRIEEEKKKSDEAKEKLKWIENAESIGEMDDKLKRMIWDDPKQIKNRILNLQSEIEEAKMKILKCEKAEELAQEKSRLEQQRILVIELSDRVSHISKLKMIANELEHKRMISILDTINDFANEILTILFDEPIKIEFMVYKKAKTNDKIKPSIVYKILYKGYEMDHVDQLSGGEGDRVSLAVTCALFHFSKFPFLLLDEFASSLDLNTKEMAIKSLKTFLGIGTLQDPESTGGSKGILCISHDTVEGIYDCTIPLVSRRNS
jgi:DNA repair exonuclease SbcCD ATPase subunit